MNNKLKVIAFNPVTPIPTFSKDMPVTEEQFTKIISAETLFDKLEGLETKHCKVKVEFKESTTSVTCYYKGHRCFYMAFTIMPTSLNMASLEVPEQFRNQGLMKTISLNFLRALHNALNENQIDDFTITAESIHIATYKFFNPLNRDPKIQINEEGRLIKPSIIYCIKNLSQLLLAHNKKGNRRKGSSCTVS